eukprot:CAMPEP_0115493716 /NCGR_PEP_ID=MMETSP0271-20121206/64339_1 /TAXON_ID=71861 /ORGANISM="Scrippsiella trochoidea, Strain CCMP3099" /LENGTH=35 /DNA_ID= /DNA_START= /DNA_END= /DNA_ORIENTATION=
MASGGDPSVETHNSAGVLEQRGHVLITHFKPVGSW